MKGRFLAMWTVAVLSTGAAFVAYLALRFADGVLHELLERRELAAADPS